MIVELRLQLILGFDLMRAAIEGGHDLRAAWVEALDISARGAEPMPHVWGGAMACLLFCAHALDEYGLLRDFNPPAGSGEFLHSGHTARLASVYAATQVPDTVALDAMAGELAHAVWSLRERLSFHGRLVRPIGP